MVLILTQWLVNQASFEDTRPECAHLGVLVGVLDWDNLSLATNVYRGSVVLDPVVGSDEFDFGRLSAALACATAIDNDEIGLGDGGGCGGFRGWTRAKLWGCGTSPATRLPSSSGRLGAMARSINEEAAIGPSNGPRRGGDMVEGWFGSRRLLQCCSGDSGKSWSRISWSFS